MICCAIRNATSTKRRWKIEDFIGKDPDARMIRGRRKTTVELMEQFLGIAQRQQELVAAQEPEPEKGKA